MENKNNNPPERVFRCGHVKAAIWMHQKVIDNAIVNVHTIRIDRSYQNEGEEWVNTNSFFVEDLPKVVMVATEAYKSLRVNSSEKVTLDNNTDTENVEEDH